MSINSIPLLHHPWVCSGPHAKLRSSAVFMALFVICTVCALAAGYYMPTWVTVSFVVSATWSVLYLTAYLIAPKQVNRYTWRVMRPVIWLIARMFLGREDANDFVAILDGEYQ